MFVGREFEIQQLNELWALNCFQLFILYGRRRVGKTSLLSEFCKNKKSIFFSAEQSTERSNLRKFSNIIFEHYNEENIEPFSSFENAIRYINQRQNDPLVLVIDEFPYWVNVNESILSAFQHLIDHTLKEGKLFIALSGSFVSFMEEKILSSKSPIFGRRTAQLKLTPFDYLTSIKFNPNMSLEKQMIVYGCFGGTPLYLEQINDLESIEENIKRLYLRKLGYLYEEPLFLLKQEVNEPNVYMAIIEAISGGAVTSNEISQKTGEVQAKCLKYISVLINLDILTKEVPINEKQKSRKTQYKVNDSMFRFWFRYISSNKTLLETGAIDITWKRKIEPDLSNFMGIGFEYICKQYLTYQNTMDELPILATEIGRWWGTDNITKKQVEIDLIAKDGDKYIFAECKWRNEVTDVPVYHKLVYNAQVFSKHISEAWFMIFSKSGFSENMLELAKRESNIILISLNDMV